MYNHKDYVLSLNGVRKAYHNHLAVANATFDVPRHSIFGLLGPNGAGKTSLIRIITSITAADKGTIMVNGEPLKSLHANQMGYLPEERGLYKKMNVGEQLLYLAQLKGLKHGDAKKKIRNWLEKFNMQDWWKKKIGELSKGMQQKVQFVATVVHDPSLIILDEPFTGLDPINTNLIKDEIFRLNEQGTSIIFSTHRMEQVEEICRDIVLMNNGEVILSGKVSDIKQRFKENLFEVEYEGDFQEFINKREFDIISHTNTNMVVKKENSNGKNQLLKSLLHHDIEVRSYNELLPSLNDIFIKQVKTTDE